MKNITSKRRAGGALFIVGVLGVLALNQRGLVLHGDLILQVPLLLALFLVLTPFAVLRVP